jgi:hypothetical protein
MEYQMAQTFKLVRAGEAGSVVPASGEDLGVALAEAAEAKERRHRENPQAQIMYWGNTVAQMYFLAAEAFEQGASASIGHNRSTRYTERAEELRALAASILGEAKGERDAVDGARMKAAFVAGYEGRDGSRYSFDARAAFLVGRHFAAQPLPMPTYVEALCGDTSASNYIEADGERYAVRYPGGNMNAAEVGRA